MGRSIETKIRRQEAREAKKEKRMKRAVEKFAEEREEIVKVDPLLPLNKKQKALLHALKNKTLIVVNGLAGTGKTFMAAAYAADLLRENEIDKIIVCRPLVAMGATAGYLPGGIKEKLEPYVKPMLSVIESRLGKGAYNTLLADGTHGRIEICPFESMRGRSLGSNKEPVIVLVDECQNATAEEIFSIITRIGEGSKVVLMGDVYQRDTKNSGLNWLINFIRHHPNMEEHAGVVEFNEPEDIVRSGLVKDVILGAMEDLEEGRFAPVKC